MEDRFSSTFFIRKSRSKKSNKCDIYLRITANGKRSEMSINRKIEDNQWNKRSSRVMGRNHDADMLNTYMDMITSKLNKIHQR
ncbi:site-specific integrase, partial [Gelidibacter salicanalis]|nr:site-specific integrase [Gelidibacter salicanalis]